MLYTSRGLFWPYVDCHFGPMCIVMLTHVLMTTYQFGRHLWTASGCWPKQLSAQCWPQLLRLALSPQCPESQPGSSAQSCYTDLQRKPLQSGPRIISKKTNATKLYFKRKICPSPSSMEIFKIKLMFICMKYRCISFKETSVVIIDVFDKLMWLQSLKSRHRQLRHKCHTNGK